MEYILSKEESERINILKFLAIIFVVFIHSYTTTVSFAGETLASEYPRWFDIVQYLFSQVIARCGVPFFFLISSILLFKKKREYLPTLKSKMKTLMIPYLFWNTLWIAVFFVLQSIPFTKNYFSGTNILIKDCDFVGWLKLYGIGAQYPQDYPLWFIRDLIVVTLFFPIIVFLVEKAPKVFLFVSITLLFVPIDFLFKEAFSWTFVGCCIVKLSWRMEKLDKISMLIVGVIYIFLMAVIIGIYILGFEFSMLSMLFIFSSIIFWIKISRCIYNRESFKDMLLKISQWTFIIYVAHELTLSSMKKVCFKILPNNPIVILTLYFILPVIVIVLCIIAGKAIKCLMPKFYGWITGGRV